MTLLIQEKGKGHVPDTIWTAGALSVILWIKPVYKVTAFISTINQITSTKLHILLKLTSEQRLLIIIT